jgi:TRAP transporter TAXI family solute receptor
MEECMMRTARGISGILVIIMMLMTTSAYGSDEFISIGTSSSGGTFNTLAVAIAQMWNEKVPGTHFSAEVTGGSSENCMRLGLDEIQMAFAAASSAYEAYSGIGQFQGQRVEKIRAIANLYPAVMQMPVLKNSGIKYVGDIVGKKINIGQAGSGSEAQTLAILEVYGIPIESFKPQQLSHANASDALVDEKLDGYINLGSLMQSHQMNAMSSGKVVMASFGPDDQIKKLVEKYPYYYKYIMPAGTYPNQDQDVDTIATGTILIVNADISEELVYQSTKALFENVEILAQSQAIASEIQLKTALNISDIPLHPGAERYYKEVGIR